MGLLLVLPRVATQRHRSRRPSNKRHKGCSMPAPCTLALLWAARSSGRTPGAAGSLKPGTDEPQNGGAARAASGRHAAPPKPPPLKQTPQGYFCGVSLALACGCALPMLVLGLRRSRCDLLGLVLRVLVEEGKLGLEHKDSGLELADGLGILIRRGRCLGLQRC